MTGSMTELESFFSDEGAEKAPHGFVLRMLAVCKNNDVYKDNEWVPSPITTVAELRQHWKEHPYSFRRSPNVGEKSIKHLEYLFDKLDGLITEPIKFPQQNGANCIWCGEAHAGRYCALVRVIEYHENGNLKRVEFAEPRARMLAEEMADLVKRGATE